MTHWPAHNLEEVVSFLRTQHPGERGLARAVSERLGITVQAVSAVFRKDDASLAWIGKVAAAYGFQLRLSFPEIAQKGGRMLDKVAAINFPNAANLSGLVECVKRSNMTINALSRRINVHYVTIERAFETGDIKISVMKRIAQALGIRIQWTWAQIDK